MGALLKNSWILFKISSTLQTNSLISLLRKLPLLEHLIPVSLYRKNGLKQVFALGGLLKGLLGGLIGKSVLCLLMLSWIPSLLGGKPLPEEMLILYSLTECLVPAIMYCGIFRAREADYTFLNHFMMNPTVYYHYKIAKEALEKAIVVIPVLGYLLRDVRFVLLAVTATVCFSLTGCCLHLWLYDRLHNVIKRSVRTITGYGIMLAVYFVWWRGWFAEVKISGGLCLWLCIGMAAVSFVCYLRLLHYKEYKRIAVQFANKEAVAITVSVNVAAEEGRDELTKFTWEKNKEFYEKHKKLDESTYLNRAFFERFRQIFSNQRKQIFFLSIPLGALVGYCIRTGILNISEDTILNYTPILIALVNSIMLFGQRFTSLCFRFVDMPLMYHQVCKQEYLKKSIRCRYVFLVKHSLVALAGLSLFVGLVLLVSGIRISTWNLIFLLLSMELFMLVQELYQLLIYYWIQPYTADFSVKSPVFRVLGWIESLFDISVLFIRGNLALVCLPLLGLFLLVNVLMLVMQKNVHKTFRLRY